MSPLSKMDVTRDVILICLMTANLCAGFIELTGANPLGKIYEDGVPLMENQASFLLVNNSSPILGNLEAASVTLPPYETGQNALQTAPTASPEEGESASAEGEQQADGGKDAREAAQDAQEGDDDTTGGDGEDEGNSSSSSSSSESESESSEEKGESVEEIGAVNVYFGGRPGSAIPLHLLAAEIGALPEPTVHTLPGAHVLLVPPKTGLIRQSPVAIFPYSQPITSDSLNQPRMISPHIIYPILARLRQRISMPNTHPETALPSQPTGPLPTGLLPDTDQITPTSTPNSAQATLINSNGANNEQTASSLSLDPNNTSTSTANQPESSTSATLTTTVAANETTTLRSNPGTNNSSFEGPIGMFKRSVAEERTARNVGGKSGTRKAAAKATQERLRPRRLSTAQRKLLLSKWGAAKHAQLKNTRAIFSPTEK